MREPPRRVVSLVPSETYSVVVLAGADRLVGRTRYCVEPSIEHVPVVGGTKDVDVEAVVALAPDLVLANREENARGPVEALIARGLPVHVSFPCSVADSVGHLRDLARLLHVEDTHADALATLHDELAGDTRPPVPTFVPIWNDPWMTFDARAFASDVLELAGASNVFADRPRRYPLAADLGQRAPLPPERVEGRDTRYPRVTLEEIRDRAPQLVLLPDEPHEFTEADAQTLEALGIPRASIRFVSGKDLFWYGAWLLEGLPRLRASLHAESQRADGSIDRVPAKDATRTKR
ncbi:MAG: ABC transporter substrate-binding protein [Sandaracinus sp.]|nr:ABC transporter substrate-binding protein [Sandaracinus sp.]MCB9618413.1 ABC transporter substrate-binding protein [Sandaracinus sp.]